MKKVLIIGYGSIGKRHAELFKTEKAAVGLVTSQKDTPFEAFASTDEALKKFNPQIVLVTNETDKHFKTLNELSLLGFKGRVFIEKPLADSPIDSKAFQFESIHVLYNLRMSPLLMELKRQLSAEVIVSANVYCGQHLSAWRPDRDYRDTYSAKKSGGGGVIRDLSHELDYATWIFGDFKKIAALGGHLSQLEIDSDDTFNIVGRCSKAPSVNITISYLDRNPRRTILVNTNNKTFYVDFIKGELSVNGEVILTGIKTSETYHVQTKNILEDKFSDFCSLDHGNTILKLIEAAEKSSSEERFENL